MHFTQNILLYYIIHFSIFQVLYSVFIKKSKNKSPFIRATVNYCHRLTNYNPDFTVFVFFCLFGQGVGSTEKSGSQRQKLTRKIIAEQNIRKIGELIALGSVRTQMIHSARDLYYVYQNLYKDVYCRNDPLKPYSEDYDYAEEAVCFLCRYIGKKLGDLCIGKFGKPIPIRLACYRYIGRLLSKKYNQNAKYEVGSYEDKTQPHNELTIDPYENQSKEESCERYDKIIKNMALPDYEYETLLAMMSGMRLIDMKRYFNVDYTTIYRRKIRIQKKYLHAVSALQ